MQAKQRQQEHQCEGNGHQRGTQLGDFSGAQFVGQPARQRGCQRPSGTCNTVSTCDRTAQLIMFHQHHCQR
ncbi:hypothetical protein D3C75_1192490 [compost metagenome]